MKNTGKIHIENQNLIDEEGNPYKITREGSLGLLAVGYRGIVAWKQLLKKDS